MATLRSGCLSSENLRCVAHPETGMWHAFQMAKKAVQRHFIRAWRKYRGLSQQQLADRMGVARSYVGHVETGRSRYDQPFLEAAADALNCAPADLIMRDPSQPDALWSIWDQIRPPERDQALRILETFTKKTGTQG